MLLKTHFAIAVFFVILFLPIVNDKIIFVVTCLIATYLPDVDSPYSTLGRKKPSRIIQFFVKHRGFLHSFTFLLVVTVLFALYIPILAFGFFLGYGLHLLIDSFTLEGIAPFWPFKKRVMGKLRTGGKIEIGILIAFIVVDVLLLATRFSIF